MTLPSLIPSRKLWLLPLCVALVALAAVPSIAQDDDPPDEAGRISWVSGSVSIQPQGSDDWGQAYVNLPVGPDDRLVTDADGWAEIQIGQTYLRIGPNSDVSLVSDSSEGIDFGVAQGSVHLRTFGLWQGQWMSVSTPNGNARFTNQGELRVDVMPEDGASVYTNLGSEAWISGADGFNQEIENSQSLELAGANPVYPQWLQPANPDGLDTWSQQRDQWITHAVSYNYVSPDVPGVADLDANGNWMQNSEYGPIWFPTNVDADWAPYRDGRWVNQEPWGWVWVEDEPWGYAPFHYGRWVRYSGRWGWLPGPRDERSVWSPALVAFAGGIQVGGVGVSAWFPLGPGEAYHPWYHASPNYVDRVNITNIRESRAVHVQSSYANSVNVRDVNYVNRTDGFTAMRHEDFAAGRSARKTAVAVDPRSFAHVQVLARPAPVPTKQSFVSRPVSQPVRVTVSHPVFVNRSGQFVSNRPGAKPVAPPARSMPPARPLPGRTVVAPPATSRFQPPAGARGGPVNPTGRPMPPAQNRSAPYQGQPYTPNQQVRPVAPVPPPSEVRPTGGPMPPAQNRPKQYPGQPYTPNQQVRPVAPVPPPSEVRPTGRPLPPAKNRPAPYQGRPYTPNQPVRPVAPVPPPREVRPTGRPMPPAQNRPEPYQGRPYTPNQQVRPMPPPQNRQEVRPNQPPAEPRQVTPPPNRQPEPRAPQPPNRNNVQPPQRNGPGQNQEKPKQEKPKKDENKPQR